MPMCSIKQCGARKSKNRPNLTLHSVPKNEVMRRKWLNAIGLENINPRHKELYICSLHFEESHFNRTLDVVRLRENAVPTVFNMPSTSKHMIYTQKENLDPSPKMPPITEPVPVLCGSVNVPELQVTAMSHQENKLALTYETLPTSKNVPVLCETRNIQGEMEPKKYLFPAYDMPSSSSATSEASILQKKMLPLPAMNKQILVTAANQVSQEFSKVKKLEKICQEQKKKIKRLREKVRRQGKKIGNLEDILKDLKQKLIINSEQSILLEECGGSQDFLKRQIAKSKGLPLEKKYSEEIRKFALTLHFLSPKAYDYIRRVYNTCLPHPRTLSKWYQNVNAEAGFTKESFDTLKKMVEQSKPQKILCALVLDEIAIRKGLTWDPKAQKYHGRVDYGHHIDRDSAEEANQCLVLMLTCINGAWKLPIGYFFITSLSGEQKCLLVETAIQMTENTGTQVVSVTCDGPASNFSMFSALGCALNKTQENTSFQTDNENRVHAFIDPCHAIKLIRNTLGDLRVLIDGLGRKIEFKYLELLLSLQEQQGLHLGTKISKAHILYEKQKMKVRLATQLFSNSVADALRFCREELKLQEFEECEGTVNFINTINNVFDVLNSHSMRPPGLKKAMCPANIGFVRAFFEGAIDYLRTLKLPSGELLIQSRRKTGFIGLIIDMTSALNLYEDVVDKGILKYVPMYKISQDHLDLFFSSIRARGGFNNNPNAVQFRAAYKKLLVRAEIRDGGIGNCIALEQINILTCSSANPIENINNLTEKNMFVEIEEDHSELYGTYLESLASDTNKYQESVVEYIAGFVSRKLSNNLKCDICVQLLSGEENKKSLIYLKSRGGLKYASADVINIIKKAENVIKKHLGSNKKPEEYYLYIFKFFVEFYGFDNQKVLSVGNVEHDTNHRVLLIKSIIKTYIDIRYRYYGKKAT